MSKKILTVGEQFFEQYLISQGLKDFKHEKIYPGKIKRPDYSVVINSSDYLFEVKDFDGPLPLISPYGTFYDAYRPIREKINQATKKFKEFKDWPCCLVLYNNSVPLIHLEEFEIMLGAMYGDVGVAFDVNMQTGVGDITTARAVFGPRGKMVQPRWSKPQNTTISAVITLRHVAVGKKYYEKYLRDGWKTHDTRVAKKIDFDIDAMYLGVIVWENIFARKTFPRELFSGPYDERYGLDGNVMTRIFAGAGILAYEALDAEM